ncbi:MAG: transcription antitermination factor NusB [Erysipelotrichaceae bacterium]|nr:transcription antitermination factor NusB [Erysipelotrichaceae bacterium]MBQ6216355.1 transcription antitermination factor NusB [Erysipelotrichaceae bacterium]MBR6233212.1 transcription antitermination factor NusB [Erysipelotrichaceae bacterium]
MLNRHEYREKIVFALYQHLLLHKDLLSCFLDNFDEDDNEYMIAIRNDLLRNKEDYISEISAYLNKWTFERLNLVEQAILLETVSEIKQGLNDKAVVIDEAIILAKQYCDEESYKYINGVLDHICSSSQ